MKNILLLFTVFCLVGNSFAQQFNPDSTQVYFINNISGSSSNITAFADGNNGSYVFWLDGRGSSNKTAIYFQHLNTFGVPQYLQNGKKIVSAYSAASYLTAYKVIKWQSGFVITWLTNTDSLFCNYFSVSGNSFWSAPTLVGKKAPSIIYVSNNGMNIMPTDSGLFINYSLIYTGGSEGFAFNRIDSNGVLRWPINNFQISSSGYYWATTSDKHNGFYYAVSTGGLGAHIYVQHFNLQGVKSYTNDLDISTLAGGRGNSTWRITCDDDTNAYVVWESNTASNIVISKITPNNGLAWTPNYRSICSASGAQSEPVILFSDNSIYSVWNDGRAPASNSFIYAQRTDTAGNMLWRQNGDSLCRLGSYIPAPGITKNASGDLISTFLMSPGFLAQRIDTAANHKWKANGRAISAATADKPFYGDYALVSNPDSSTTIYWLSFSTKKVCAAKMNYYGNLENQIPVPTGVGVIVGNDTICDGATAQLYTIPSITGALSYHWHLPTGVSPVSGSDTTLSPAISLNFASGLSSATISVSGQNNIGEGANSPDFTITIKTVPNSAGSISGSDSAAACINQNGIIYSIPALANAEHYLWTLPPNSVIAGTTDSNYIAVNYSAYSSSGNITVSGSNTCGAGIPSSLAVNFKGIPAVDICYATVDSVSQKAQIFWQKPSENYVDGYVIYREISGVFTAIDTVPNSVFSSYLDTGSNPVINAEKYKIAALDTCGNIGDISSSFNHQTIHLYGSIQPGGITKLYWTNYVGINDPGRYYTLLRDTIGIGQFDDTLFTNISPSAALVKTDLTSILYPFCSYRVDMSYSSSCTPSLKLNTSLSTTRSNIKNKTALFDSSSVNVAALENEIYELKIFPNPAKDKVNISFKSSSKNITIAIYNLVGKEIYSTTLSESKNLINSDIPLTGISDGLYLLKIHSASFEKIVKLAVN